MAGVISSAFHLHDQDIDHDEFFTKLIKLDVNDEQGLSSFLNEYKFKKLSVKGLNRDLIFAGREATALFDDFTLEIWKKYYVNEEVIQIAILQGTLPFPLEVRCKNEYLCTFVSMLHMTEQEVLVSHSNAPKTCQLSRSRKLCIQK